MKKTVYFVLILTSLCYSCSPQIIRKVSSETKAQVSISSPSKAAFFVQNDKITASEEQKKPHKRIADSIYNQFGGATDKMLVGRTNAQLLKFSVDKNKTWIVNVSNFKNKSALILFDGQHKPIVEYNVQKYQTLVNQYFSKEIKQGQKSIQRTNTLKYIAGSSLDSIWAIPFIPNEKYAYDLIHNSNTSFYPLPPFKNDTKTNGTLQIISYLDLEKTKIYYEVEIDYKNGNMMKYAYKNKQHSFNSIYHRSNTGLLDSISNLTAGQKPQITIFKYLPNSYLYTFKGNNFRDEFIMNNKKQVTLKKKFNEKGQLTSKTIYTHDNQSRILKEESYDRSVYTGHREYIYLSPNSNKFASMLTFNEKGILTNEIKREIKGDFEYFTIYTNGQKISETIFKLNKLGEGEVINKNAKGELTSIDVYKKLKK